MCVMCGGSASDQAVDHSIDHPFELAKNNADKMLCQTCGEHVSKHPDKLDYLQKRTMEQIVEYGHQVRYIFGGDHTFWYSVGRCVKDRPELLVTGPLAPEMGMYIVNRVAELDDESPIAAGDELDEVLDGYRVRLVAVRDLEEAQMHGVTNNFGTEDTTALQVLWPDAEGRFPGDPGFEVNEPIFA